MRKTFELARPVDSAPTIEEAVEANPHHLTVEPKLDGVRVLVHCMPGYNIKVTTRTEDSNGNWREIQDRLPSIRDDEVLKELTRHGYTVFDGELVAPVKQDTLAATMSVIGSTPERAEALQRDQGPLVVHAFDMLFHKGDDIKNLGFWMRRSRLGKLLDIEFNDTPIRRMPSYDEALPSNRCDRIRMFLKEGAEGAVLKAPHGAYGGAGLGAWVRFKESFTTDAQVTGWVAGGGKYEGLIGAVEVSVIDHDTGALRAIGCVAPGTDEKRRQLSEVLMRMDRGAIIRLGLVAEVGAQKMTPAGRLRHPRIYRWRQDRNEPNVYDFRRA